MIHTLNIPDGMRIGEAISRAIMLSKEFSNLKDLLFSSDPEKAGFILAGIEDQDLLNLIAKLK
jgi:hypothetical protein